MSVDWPAVWPELVYFSEHVAQMLNFIAYPISICFVVLYWFQLEHAWSTEDDARTLRKVHYLPIFFALFEIHDNMKGLDSS